MAKPKKIIKAWAVVYNHETPLGILRIVEEIFMTEESARNYKPEDKDLEIEEVWVKNPHPKGRKR